MLSYLAAIVLSTTPAVSIKVDGEGYLRFIREGRVVYAKEAVLVVEGGKLCSKAGAPVIPTIQISNESTGISIDLQGNVQVNKGLCGRLVLALFSNEGTLQSQNGFLIAADRPRLGNPGEDTCGVIRTISAPTQTPIKTGIAAPQAPIQRVQPKPIVKAATEKPPTEQTSVLIAVRPQSPIEGKTFTLGEIADINGPTEMVETLKAVVIGDSPPLGTERGVDQIRVLARLRMAGLKTDGWSVTVPASAKVVREGMHIPNDDFLRTAQQAVRDQLAITGNMVAATPAPEMVVPRGELQLVAETATGNGMKASVVVGVYIDSKRFNSRTVNLVGSPNTIFIRTGAAVKIRVVSSGAVVETTGKAKSAGSVGQTIEVQTDLGATFTGTVLENGMVEVRL